MRTISLAVLAGSALLFLSCSSGRYADGSYRGLSSAMPDCVAVTVDVRNGKIVDIRPEGQSRAHGGLFDGAFDAIRKAVLAKQAAGVDGVAGATVSSDAIKAAIEAALTEAGKR